MSNNITYRIYSDMTSLVGFIVIDGKRLNVIFDGVSREALTAKMAAWWQEESARARRLLGSGADDNQEPLGLKPVGISAKGASFVGTRWMAHGELKERVPASDVAARLEQGWIFKGPRS